MLQVEAVGITRISKSWHEGHVYNLELESLEPGDDLFWVEHDSGIVSHNCLPKDSLAFCRLLESFNVPADAVQGFIAYNEAIRDGVK